MIDYESYVTSDGVIKHAKGTTLNVKEFKPLLLPERGELLEEGRQYLLTPLARDMLDKEFGYRGVPTVVECVRRRVAPTRIVSTTTNLETEVYTQSIVLLDEQQATFRAFLAHRRHITFPLDLAAMDSRAEMYAESHVIPASLVEEWAEETKKYPISRKFRGCTLRWWEAGAKEHGEFVPRKSAKREKINLSCLD